MFCGGGGDTSGGEDGGKPSGASLRVTPDIERRHTMSAVIREGAVVWHQAYLPS